MIRCIYGARFSMTAEVLRFNEGPPVDPVLTPTPGPPGNWVTNQDPITGEIITEWVPGAAPVDDPTTPDVNEATDSVIVPCFAQGIYNSGIRAAGDDETFGALYYNTEYIKMWLPANVTVTKRDRITNIKDSTGTLVFRDEEYMDGSRATVFNVNGVTPRFDYRNKLVDWFVLLEKAQ